MANSNTVTISQEEGKTTSITGSVYGGRSAATYHCNTYYNKVNISGGTVGGEVYGGSSTRGLALHNTVNITGGQITSNVFGGRTIIVDDAVSTINNKVNISGDDTKINGDVFGGHAYRGTVGGDGTAANPGNSVTVSGGKISGLIAGGRVGGTSGAESSPSGSANYNTVNISGGEVRIVLGGYGANANANYNSVEVSGGTVKEWIAGGNMDSHGSTTNNSVTVSGGTLAKSVYGGRAYIAGGTASNNTVTIVITIINPYKTSPIQ